MTVSVLSPALTLLCSQRKAEASIAFPFGPDEQTLPFLLSWHRAILLAHYLSFIILIIITTYLSYIKVLFISPVELFMNVMIGKSMKTLV